MHKNTNQPKQKAAAKGKYRPYHNPKSPPEDDDNSSAVSSATPIISNNSSHHSSNSKNSKNSNSSKRKKKHRRQKSDDGSGEDASHVTPVISNKTPVPYHEQETKPRAAKDEIDYGQIVVDARTTKPSRALGEYKRVSQAIGPSSGRSSRVTFDPDVIDKSSHSTHSSNANTNANTNANDTGTGTDSEPLSRIDELPQVEGEQQVQQQPTNRRKGFENIMFETVWLPFLVSLFSTIRFLLSTTSSLSCQFIKIDVGFIPSNVKFVSSTIDIGPWAYSRGKCLAYPEDFTKVFIHKHASWGAARVAAVVNMILGFIVFLTAAFVIVYKVLRIWPTSARATTCIKGFDGIWEIWVFVCVILMFIFELMKFSLWSVDLCTKDVWMTDKFKFVMAQECSLSTGAKCALSALVFDLAIVILLTMGSKNLRTFLEKNCCRCRKKQEGREPVRTVEDEEMPGPRCFFEGVEGDEKSNHDVAIDVSRREKGDSSDSSDGESVAPGPNKSKTSRSVSRGDDSDSDSESVIPRTTALRDAWIDMGRTDSDVESIFAKRSQPTASSQVPQQSQVAVGRNTLGTIQSVPEDDEESDADSESEDSESDDSHDSNDTEDTDDTDGETESDSKPASSADLNQTNPFPDGTADLLGFNDDPEDQSEKPRRQRSSTIDDSDEIGFPSLF